MNDYTGNSLPYKFGFTWESQIYPPAVSISQHSTRLQRRFFGLWHSQEEINSANKHTTVERALLTGNASKHQA